MKRCSWVSNDEIYINYHDNEWGVPVYDDRLLFEMLTLEGAQAGLSFLTILKKRENYKKAFDNFEVYIISKYDNNKIDELMNNIGIVRNKLKINSVISNAKCFIEVQKEFGSFKNYIWGFTDNKIINNSVYDKSVLKTHDELSDKISRDLKKRGFKFIGTTIIYSYMQAIGIINDHFNNCICKNK